MKIKQVIVIRKDLKMRRGKEIAQGSHASMAFLVHQLRSQMTKTTDSELTIQLGLKAQKWMAEGAAKICVVVESEQQLIEVHDKAIQLGLCSHLIRDSGRTEFNNVATLTACAIGPDDGDDIDKVTGSLKLY